MKQAKKTAQVEPQFILQHKQGPLIDGWGSPQFKAYKMKDVDINISREEDSCVCLRDGSIVVVKNFAYHHGSDQMKLVGAKFKYKDNCIVYFSHVFIRSWHFKGICANSKPSSLCLVPPPISYTLWRDQSLIGPN